MFVRNGILSNLRARGRTALFSALIFALTLLLVLALGVQLYCAGALAQCDRLYRTIAQVEYMGAEYPDADEPDAFARKAYAALDADALCGVDGVLSFHSGERSLIHVAGYTRFSGQLPYRNYGVIVISHISSPVYESYYAPPADGTTDPSYWDEEDFQLIATDQVSYYTAIMGPVPYTFENKSDIAVSILPGELHFAPEKGKAYVVHGMFLEDGIDTPLHGVRSFQPLPFPNSDALPWAEYTGTASVSEPFLRAAEEYRLMNSYVELTTCPDIENLPEFHQGQLYLTAGRMPSSESECLISADMARALSCKVGDALNTAAFSSAEDNRYRLTLTDRRQTLTVAGIVNQSDDYLGHVWRLGQGDTTAPLFGYALGTARLENSKAARAVLEMQSLLPDNVRVTVLDQGYADASTPFRTMRATATRILAVCIFGMAAVLVLFAYLYVGRQNDTVNILVSLGTPRRHITLWLLSGAAAIAGSASVLGGALGGLLLPPVFRAVQSLSERGSSEKLRYSETALGVVKDVPLSIPVPAWPLLALVAAVIAAALGLCLFFLRTAYRRGTPHRGKTRVHVPRGKTTTGLRGSARFAWLSIRRGGTRSAVVPLVSAALTVIMLFLGGVYQLWETQLHEAVASTTLEGQVTSTSGRFFSGLVIPIDTVRMLSQLEDVDKVYVSQRSPYYLPDEMPAFGATAFGEEHRAAWIAMQPDLVSCNALNGAKEFYFTDAVVTWLDGWDESCLSASYAPGTGQMVYRAYDGDGFFASQTALPAVVSDRFLSSHALTPGDTLEVVSDAQTIMLQVVGVYKQSGNRAHIYVPLAKFIRPDYVFGDALPSLPDGSFWSWTAEDYAIYAARSATFSTCRFTLSSAAHLDKTRQRLYEAGFSWPEHLRSVRTTLILRDASFIKITQELGRYLSMGQVMMGMIFAVVALLGLIISWLMINGRKREFGLMRGFGAPRSLVFRSFFGEQALLCVLGCAVGCVSLIWLSGGTIPYLAVGAYLIFYLSGAAAAVLLSGRIRLMDLLVLKE